MPGTTTLRQQRAAGLVTGSAVVVYVLSAGPTPVTLPGPTPVTAAGIFLAGLVMIRWYRLGIVATTVGLATFVMATAPSLLESPAGALATWIPTAWLIAQLWLGPGLSIDRRIPGFEARRIGRAQRARSMLRMTALAAILAALAFAAPPPDVRIAVLVGLTTSVAFVLRALPLPLITGRPGMILAALGLIGAVSLGGAGASAQIALVGLASISMVASSLVRPTRRPGIGRPVWWERQLEHPARQLVLSFFALIVLGTTLLALPIASADSQHPIPLIDAAFTSVSAVCVTGLVVQDTPVAWSGFGLITILVLIQLGGLGIMTFATAILGVVGRRLSIRAESAVAELTGGDGRHALHLAVKRILRVTLCAEAVGAVLLTVGFLTHGDPVGTALWRGTFTAVSAFCNAGFALQSDSLASYGTNAFILHVVAGLIVLGGLSPAVVTALPSVVRRRRVPLQAKLVLATSGILLAFGTALIAATEWNNTLEGLDPAAKWTNSWFQSVTLRTAGFNSIDIGALRAPTITLFLIWMFIGGSPGGTAGGTKTTTLAILLLAVYASIRGRGEIHVFGRSIPHAGVYRAASVATLGLLSLVAVLWALQLTQDLPSVPALFEAVSALGTVGLSMGATASLDAVGKIIIMVAMFAGRVGSLTLFVFLLAPRAAPSLQFPQEPVDCG